MVLDMLDNTQITLMAHDKHVETSRKSTPKGNSKPWQRKAFSITNIHQSPSNRAQPTSSIQGAPDVTGGLSSCLKLALNCRVMLKRNINQSKSLVNGLTGVLERLDTVNDGVKSLGIRFDRLPSELVWIDRVSVAYDMPSGERRSRYQFPIEPAFAVTIHKSQGLTLSNVILSTVYVYSVENFLKILVPAPFLLRPSSSLGLVEYEASLDFTSSIWMCQRSSRIRNRSRNINASVPPTLFYNKSFSASFTSI
uniref:ATP-dependent DNA helicase PIF1 n=1 Tax=Caenorhabditis tropicalis TaxID=1561998 RepID=A0A1I7T639_9PELO